ncbi:hypothetical protein [Vreelandella populi]|uniref:hypothetical protein n=1 Tax=Vreelandella populi TaxID=2498858 RepID=UPI000F8E3A88|nr:hypothetical protein [Halomonas populi]RUR38531.1 hypothetical protein ELY25_09210 [Halomonas populi]
MTLDSTFALIQIPLAALTAVLYGRQFAKPESYGIRRFICLSIAGVSCGMVTWRLGTVSQIIEPEFRAAGGMLVQTLYQIVVLSAYTLLKEPSGQGK